VFINVFILGVSDIFMANELEKLKIELQSKADAEQARNLQRFFKTGKGEYGEGDLFLGVVVPDERKIAKKFCGLELEDIQELLNSKFHEERMIGLFILVNKYTKCKNDELNKKRIVDFYLRNSKKINNWDLVDLSAHKIIGAYLLDKPEKEKEILYKLAKSDNLWERRVAIISTFEFIRNNQFEDSLKIGKILLADEHDLIHKAVGWMLREVGKRDVTVLEEFLKQYYKKMPRTMLRYSIEKFSEEKRKRYLAGRI
jgi:3-methyladenine DNA glycosylase AlkD